MIMENAPDNNVRINYTFEIPVTEALQAKIPGYDSMVAGAHSLDKSLGKELIDFFRVDYPQFTGKFVLTKTSPVMVGMYSTESIVKRSQEAKGLEFFRVLLKELTGTDDVKAEINLSCFL